MSYVLHLCLDVYSYEFTQTCKASYMAAWNFFNQHMHFTNEVQVQLKIYIFVMQYACALSKHISPVHLTILENYIMQKWHYILIPIVSWLLLKIITWTTKQNEMLWSSFTNKQIFESNVKKRKTWFETLMVMNIFYVGTIKNWIGNRKK